MVGVGCCRGGWPVGAVQMLTGPKGVNWKAPTKNREERGTWLVPQHPSEA